MMEFIVRVNDEALADNMNYNNEPLYVRYVAKRK